MSHIRDIFDGIKKRRLERQAEEKTLRFARLDASYLLFPSSPRRILAGVAAVSYAFRCFYEPPSPHFFDGRTRFLLLVIAIGSFYLGCYQAKIKALRKLIEKESPTLFAKIKNTSGT